MEKLTPISTASLLINGDVVQMPIAQKTGWRVILIAFSFCWVGHPFRALMSEFQVTLDGKLLLHPDFPIRL
ncbi:hypothetical protein B0J12DRAFT_642683 [Macrophomina phaseolina]|uniref:Uncharacterized protein n=1 Tax=Macrophomina phaseolina TaxID=35725 RepID=A0ABQ8GSE8_9PEZI|nr:hypothetical protein B0J12DRAFT_642683 [Macrophomina phaseolina]